jgi:hypothetical protein
MSAAKLASLALVASACGWMPEYEPRTEGFQDAGALCFTSRPDGRLQVVVSFNTCFSSGCDRVLSATCRVSESAGVITVSSEATVERQTHECTLDCGPLTARCATAPIAPGTYGVKYGAAQSEITLPAAQVELFPEDVPSVACP